MRDLVREIAISLRALRRNRAANAGIVLTLGLVIGASAALFGTLYAIAFPRLPFRDASRLVFVEQVDRTYGPEAMSGGAFRAVQREAPGFEDLAGFLIPGPPDALYSTRLWGSQQTVAEAGSTSGLFRLFGVAPILGRPILPSDERQGAPTVAVLSNHFWRMQYGGNPSVLGKIISVNEIGRQVQYTVVGVMPSDVDFPYPLSSERPDFWTSLHADGSLPLSLLGGYLGVIGRLRPGVGFQDAQTQVRTISERLRESYPRYYKNEAMRVVSLRSELVKHDKAVLIVLGGAMGLILLLGCANVAGILLIRAMGRERETAIRAALGATRPALARQFSVETALLVLAGGALGTLVSYGGLRAFGALAAQVPGFGELGRTAMAFRIFVGAGFASAALAFLVALAPAYFRSNPDLNSLLKSGWRRARGTGVFPWSGSLLLVLQVALGLTLVAGTFALGSDLQRLLSSDEAFFPRNLVALQAGLWNTVPNTPPYVSQLFRGFLQRVRAIPGVRAVALTDGFPEPALVYIRFLSLGSSGAIGESSQPAEIHVVTPEFIRMMGFPLVRGRYFGEGDTLSSKPVALINTAMAQRYWPGEDPIGAVLKSSEMVVMAGGQLDTFQIVGVVREPRRFGSGSEAPPAVYLSFWQVPARRATVVARTTMNPASISGALRAAALKIAPGETNLGAVRTGEDLVAESSARVRLTTALVASFGVLALLLLVAGTYAVVSYHSARRTREMGIRMALGLTPFRVRMLVVRQGMLLVSAGVVLGLVGAVLFAKSISSLLYGAQLRGFGVFCGSAALVLAAALLACYVPSRQATQIDPATTLREE